MRKASSAAAPRGRVSTASADMHPDTDGARQARGGDTSRMQRRRILQRLKYGPATPDELRTECGVALPMQRVNELRVVFDWPIELERVGPTPIDGARPALVRFRLDPDAAPFVDALVPDSFLRALLRGKVMLREREPDAGE